MDWWIQLDEQVRRHMPELRMLCDEPMSRHTSFHIGGPARRMAFPDSPRKLALLHGFARSCGARPLIIGKGTNLLCPDRGLDRLVISTQELSGLRRGEEEDTVLAEAGASLARLADFACQQGLSGLEFAHGIPGSVGGGVCMNAGAYGGEMCQVVSGISVLFPQEEAIRFLQGEEMGFGYRRSLLTDEAETVALYALFRLRPGDPEDIRSTMRELMARRKEKQPLEYPSAGSFFKRPEGHFAGALIQQCGLKGLTVGGAQVSEKHAGFIINRGGATCEDVRRLMEQVQQAVLERTGIALEPEVKWVE